MAVFSKTGGTNGGSYAKYFTFRLTVWEKPWDSSTDLPYNIDENKSKIGRKIELVSGQYGKFSQYQGNWSINTAGQSKSGSAYYAITTANTALTLYEDEVIIEHDTDGSKTISCSASLDMASGTYSPRRFFCIWNININKYS